MQITATVRWRPLNQELFEEFCDEFTRQMNRLRMEHRASLSAAEREIDGTSIEASPAPPLPVIGWDREQPPGRANTR